MGLRRKARECALQMLFAADVTGASRAGEAGGVEAVSADAPRVDALVRAYWDELGDPEIDGAAREFATRLAAGALARVKELDERIRSRAEHWRIARMAVVDRNILRVAVFELGWERDIPPKVAINEAIEIAKKFGTRESGRFINGVLDRIHRELRPAS